MGYAMTNKTPGKRKWTEEVINCINFLFDELDNPVFVKR